MTTDTQSQQVRRRPTSQTIFGGLVILLGVLLLLETTGVLDTSNLLTYLPSLFVLVALYALIASDFRNIVGPAIIILLAGGSQLVALGVLEFADLAPLWPVFVIVFGLSVVLARYRARVHTVADDYVSALAFFGGNEKRSTSQSFAGADLTALFGGTELDLRDAEIVNRPAHVSATAAFGGVDVVVPRDWNVRIDVIPVFGAAEDDRPRREEEHDEVDLVVTGFVAFGGVSVTE
ncbi:LiaF transmembrane domain-containing protein [Natrinema gelatinilyticum]|uniref:LiaF transmembrane domain-containing protein n=1 Tax=Natrinema gelatinilyticum TaxID=2961571 RepID=UPI0020C2C73C|nr:LiaF domain-containing protein [Natrinema gelatinilyticum]